MRIYITLAVFISLTVCPAIYAASISELLDIARAQKDAQKTYKEETEAFNSVKAAIDKGEIRKGQAKKDIQKDYGPPVVNTTDSDTGREKWIYKPASSSYFSGIKAYLFFDKDSRLDEIKMVE